MKNSNTSQGESDKKRNLPSWMVSGENRTNLAKSGENEESKEPKEVQPAKVTTGSKKYKGSDSSSKNFSKLMDGVVFALSGFVNPERATLRSQALEMGADYRQDWNSECTLLICAYSNTPKFRQVEADNGAIVKKEWITDCYSQKKLVEIDSYLMRAGKPWKKGSISTENSCDEKPSLPKKSMKRVERESHAKDPTPSISKNEASSPSEFHSPRSEVVEWVADDLKKTISWLESQEDKPEPKEITDIASGGIMLCLQDAMHSLENDEDIREVAGQWNIVPRAVDELLSLVDAGKSSGTFSKADLCKKFEDWKQTYEVELSNVKLNNLETEEVNSDILPKRIWLKPVGDYDSDETVVMTEEEINQACNDFLDAELKREKFAV